MFCRGTARPRCDCGFRSPGVMAQPAPFSEAPEICYLLLLLMYDERYWHMCVQRRASSMLA